MDPLTTYAIAQGGASLLDYGANLIGGEAKRRRQARAKRDLLAGVDKARGIYGDTYEEASGLYDPYRDAGLDALKQMQGLEADYNPNEYLMPEMGEYEFGKDVQDYLDPSMDYQQRRMQDATQSSAAAQGGLLSGKTLKALQSNASNLAQTDWGNAFNRMSQDRTFDYTDYLNRFKNQQGQIQDRYSKFQDKMNRLSGTNTLGYNASGAQSGLSRRYGQNMAGLAGQEANIKANGQMNTGSMMEDAIGGLGGLAKAGANIYGAFNKPQANLTSEQLAQAAQIGQSAIGGNVGESPYAPTYPQWSSATAALGNIPKAGQVLNSDLNL